MTKKKLKRALRFTEGDEFEWAASVIEQFAEANEANLPSFVDDKASYHGMEQGIARIRELEAMITDKKLRKKMKTDDWEDLMMYLWQEVSD